MHICPAQKPYWTNERMNSRHRIASLALGLLVSTGATALDVNVVGLFPNKAVVQIGERLQGAAFDLHHGLVWEQADDVHVQRGCAGRDQQADGYRSNAMVTIHN